jgi:hypothetical protein
VYAGLSHIQSTFLLMILASGFAASAVILPRVSWQGEAGVVGYLVLAVAFILNRLGFLRWVSVRRVLNSWILGGVNSGIGRTAQWQSRYYEIFTLPEPEPRVVTAPGMEWSQPSTPGQRNERSGVRAKDF